MANHYTVLKEEFNNTHINTPKSMFGAVEAITFFVSPRGSQFIDNGKISTSTFGHVFIGATKLDPNTGKYNTMSLGFSPGEDWNSNKDNISFNDHMRYPQASSLTMLSMNNSTLVDGFTKIYNDFKNGNTKPSSYFLGVKDCISFMGEIAQKLGIPLKLAMTPDQILSNLKHITDNYLTPLVIDLNGDGIDTIESDIEFDFSGKGKFYKTGWINKDDGFLVLDKDNNGTISGNELFGGYSKTFNGSYAKHGFEALSIYDINNDGKINSNDAVWNDMRVWRDENSDKLSQSNEIYSLEYFGIKEISLKEISLNKFDYNGNFHQMKSEVVLNDGKTIDMVDIFFRDITENKLIPQELIEYKSSDKAVQNLPLEEKLEFIL